MIGSQSLLAQSLSGPNYEALKGCEKQELLWKQIDSTVHNKLPKYNTLDIFRLVAMTFQELTTKTKRFSDVAPKKWKKYLHRRGAMAKVKFVPVPDKKGSIIYSGIFQGAECGLLRLSLTYKPKRKKAVAPGLALKILRDNMPSANVSALYTLSGQKKNYNFFANELSNIVPIGTGLGEKVVHSLFKRVSDYPEQLAVSDMAKFDKRGFTSKSINSPIQLFFVPNEKLKNQTSQDKHEIRNDFLDIEIGTSIYNVHAVSNKHKNFNYYDYSLEKREEFLKDSTLIGKLITTSKFIASEFGDTRIFFRHQVK